MKTKTALRNFLALAGSSLLAMSFAHAAETLTWDIAPGTVGIGDSAVTGGAGTWSTDIANGNWTTDAGANNIAWVDDILDPDTAIFGGTAGAITLGTDITAGGLTFNTNGYSISAGNTLTLAGATAPVISVTTGTTTIASDIAGTSGLQKTGAGTLILSGTNSSYSGTTTLSAGILQGYYGGTSLTPVSPFGASTLVLGDNTTLQLVATGTVNNTAETVNFGNNVAVGANTSIYVNRIGGTASNKTLSLGTLTIGANTLNATAPNISYSSAFSAVTMTGNATFNPGSNATLTLGGITQSGGDYSLTKTGVGTLKLTGTSDYAGGTVLNGGTLSVNSDAALGAATSSITVSGNSSLTSAAATSTEYTRAIALNAPLTISNNTNGTTATFSGAITGASNLYVGAGTQFNGVALSNTGNTFTGDLILNPTPNSSVRVSFASIADVGMISLGKNGYYRQVQYNGASNLVLNTRRLDLNTSFGNLFDGGGNNPINMFENIGAGTITFNADMTVAAGKTGTFFFGGTNVGDNTFAGIIPNSAGGVLSIAKFGAGKWIFTNDNTYVGNAVAAGGILSVAKIANAGVAQPLGVSSIIQLGISGFSGNVEFTGSSDTATDKQVQLGGTLTNGLGTGGILNNGTGTLTFGNPAFNVAQTGTTVSRILTLGGGNTGANTISGTIQNNATGGLVGITKTGAGTWVLSGANTYTSTTAVQEGTLIAGADAPSAAAGAFGNATSDINLGVANGNNNASLLTGGAFTVGRNIRLLTNNTTDTGTRVLTIGANTAHNSEFSGSVFLGTTNQAGRGVTLTAASGGQVTFSGVIQNPSGMDATSYTVTKAGLGTVVLSNSNTYNRATLITEGTLVITGPTQSTNSISFTGGTLGLNTGFPVTAASAAVNLDNGTIKVTGATGDPSYTLLTAASITGTPVLAASVPGYELQVVDGATDELRLVQTAGGSPYDTWAGPGVAFDDDANGDGVSNGLAFLLGAADPNVDSRGKLPTVTETAGGLVLTFQMLEARGGATLAIDHSSDLGITDPWTTITVPDTSDTIDDVVFAITGSGPLNVTATIPASKAAAGKLFGRLKGVNP